jgi:hypothetical protein
MDCNGAGGIGKITDHQGTMKRKRGAAGMDEKGRDRSRGNGKKSEE